jgi:hypothetical protein
MVSKLGDKGEIMPDTIMKLVEEWRERYGSNPLRNAKALYCADKLEARLRESAKQVSLESYQFRSVNRAIETGGKSSLSGYRVIREDDVLAILGTVMEGKDA